jgi:iron only hydrogenase large subunit-like protein
MIPFEKLYEQSVRAALCGEDIKPSGEGGVDPHHLDCLLNPEKHPPVIRVGDCACGAKECKDACLFDAIQKDENGNAKIREENCTGCGACIDACAAKNLTAGRDVLPVLKLLQDSDAPVYAMIAPAFISQFSLNVSPGHLRTAFKKLGFAGMIEVALFADILTLKEALEFDRSIHKDTDFMLTSCCCPVWIGMIRKVYSLLVPHIPPSVSPMVACGRSIKKLYPQAKTVFIGPCLAKKAEAREKDIAGAVDHVLTFREIRDVFEIAGIDPQECEEDLRDHSSFAGRIYARTGGVSRAVQDTLNRLVPGRKIPLRSLHADGVPALKTLLSDVIGGDVRANFIEGMGCVGGCVGGPRVLLPREEGKEHVEAYGKNAVYKTPVDNPYVIELLARLGFETIESLTEGENMFTRDLSAK